MKAGDEVTVYDRFRFAIPLKAVVVDCETSVGSIKVKMTQSNNFEVPVGKEIWLFNQQVHITSPQELKDYVEQPGAALQRVFIEMAEVAGARHLNNYAGTKLDYSLLKLKLAMAVSQGVITAEKLREIHALK